MIASVPFIPDVKSKAEPRELVYTIEQIAALLEAGWALEERQHIHMFTMIMLSTNARVEAVLQLDKSRQVRDGLIYFNAVGRDQTKKRRSVVPVCPTLASWLARYEGRVIQWQKRLIDPVTGTPFFEYLATDSIKTSFKETLIAAGISQHASDPAGTKLWLPPRAKFGESEPRPKLLGLGSPNTLRHTITTEMHRRGVPDAQIETAAGHRGKGTNKRHYRHIRPEYLTDFIAGVEAFWSDVGKLTTVHLINQHRPAVYDLAA
jgi:integrase